MSSAACFITWLLRTGALVDDNAHVDVRGRARFCRFVIIVVISCCFISVLIRICFLRCCGLSGLVIEEWAAASALSAAVMVGEDDEATVVADAVAGCTTFVDGDEDGKLIFGAMVVLEIADGIGFPAVSSSVLTRFAGGAPDGSAPPMRACDHVRFTRTGYSAWIHCWSMLAESSFIVGRLEKER